MLPATRPPGVSRVTWWRARKRGHLRRYRHNLPAEDRQVLAVLRAALPHSRHHSATELAARLERPPRRVRKWLAGRSSPPSELMPLIRLYLAEVMTAAEAPAQGHPTGTGDYTRRAAKGDADA